MCVFHFWMSKRPIYISIRDDLLYVFCSFIYLIMLWVLISYAKKSVLRSVWSISYIFWEWQSRYFVHVSIMPFFGASKQKNRSSEHMIATPKFLIFGLQILDSDLFEWMCDCFVVAFDFTWRFCIDTASASAADTKKNNDEILVFENDKRTHSRFVTVNGQ